MTFALIAISCTAIGQDQNEKKPSSSEFRWWKGNLHTHSLWSDGDRFPETVAQWYKQNEYHFVSLTEHNTIQQGEKWIQPEYSQYAQSSGGVKVFGQYLEEFGKDWVDYRTRNNTLEVRVKALDEYRDRYEEADRFMLLLSEEITDKEVVHVNAYHLKEVVQPQGGETVEEIIRDNVDAVYSQRENTDQMMFAQLNHPNFHYAITAEEAARIENLQFFEAFNCHGSVQNYGDENHIDTERFWDIVLTLRLAHLDLGIMYGLAVDDSHHYYDSTDRWALPGCGWVMVKSQFLTPEHIIKAMEGGDFYASTGVRLTDFGFENGKYWIEIDPEENIEYTVQFMGTPIDHDRSSEPVIGEDGKQLRTTRRYSDKIGQIYKEVSGTRAEYKARGDELYIRAKIISTKKHPTPFEEGDVEVAWTQPVKIQN